MFTNTETNFWQAKPQTALLSTPEGGLSYKNITIHQSENPKAEAAAWLAAKAGGQKPNLALIFGLGLGWHLKVLRQKYPAIRLVVYEPEEELLKNYRQNGQKMEGLEIFTSWPELENFVSQELVYNSKSQALSLVVPGYAELWPEAAGAFSNFVQMAIMRRSVIEETRHSTGENFMNNLAENLADVLKMPDLMLLKGRLPRRPAFIVGSGPSLDQNVHHLAAVGNNGLIIAASSALKPLLAAGVCPQVVLTLEAEDTSDFLILNEAEKKVFKPETILALAAGSHPNHFKVPGFQQAIFHLSKGEAQLLGSGIFLPQGGNAGTAAFALAYFWGLGPLVLVGQDQAYQGDNLHANQTPGGVVENDKGQTIAVKSVDNGTVETHTGLLASLNWYAETAKSIQTGANPPLLYNASAQGAKVPGFTEVPLNSLVSSLTPLSEQLRLAPVLPKLPRPNWDEVKSDLEQIAALVNTLRRFAKVDSQKAGQEIKNIGSASSFMAQLLGPASVARGAKERLAALEKADLFMTKMLISLN